MEKLQGPINPCLFENEENPAVGLGCYGQLLTSEEEALRFEEYSDEQVQLQQSQEYTLPNLEDKMPFLQMLQSVECAAFVHDPNFQPSYEFESCVSNEIVDLYSSPGAKEHVQMQPQSKQKQMSKPPVGSKEKRKRKRSKVSKNKEEVETQRMTHIAVERNRRRQMNDHLNALRSLMPSSYIQRGDQASIIGGAIELVKELEQLVRSLEAEKRMRREDSNDDVSTGSAENRSELTGENRSAAAAVDVVVIHNHVNLKIQCQSRPGQLIRSILALEHLRLTVLHLNITSLDTLIHYSFNLKIEDECNLKSAAEIAGAVHQILYNLDT